VQVRDTGKGLTDTPATTGGGVGLTNLRERLAGLHGDSGRFTIESNEPRGVVATIDIPAGAAAMSGPASNAAAGFGQAAANASRAPNPAAAPASRWTRAWQATSKTHSVWARIASRVFLALMTIAAIVFLIMLIALYTGWLPVDVVGLELDGIEGMALGSILLLAGFAVCAVVIAIVVAVFYGLGFLLAFLLLLIPVMILVSICPVLAPFIVIGFLVYWFWWRKRKQNLQPATPAQPTGLS